jgi:hypothetical protein
LIFLNRTIEVRRFHKEIAGDKAQQKKGCRPRVATASSN